MSFSPPSGVAFHTVDEIPVAQLTEDLRKIAVFLQNLQVSSPTLSLYHDWWSHDGLHFREGSLTFTELFAMVQSPRAIFEATPDDHEVFIGIAPKDSRWYLRFRAEWDADDQSIVGRWTVIVPSDLANAFRTEIANLSAHPFVEQAADAYYKDVIT